MTTAQQIPAEFFAIAKRAGKYRAELNAKTRESKKEYKTDNPYHVDFIGALGEMLAVLEMMKRGKSYTSAALLDDDPQHAPDLIVGEYNIDVKTTTGQFKRVPVHKMQKAEKHGINAYWFFKICLKQECYWHNFHKLNDVKAWNVFDYYGYQTHAKKFV